MNAFLDSSSLIKLYHQKDGSDFVMVALSSDIGKIFLSELALLDFSSAIWKKSREQKITENTAAKVIECFQTDCDTFKLIMFNSDIVESAVHLLMQYGNRGLEP